MGKVFVQQEVYNIYTRTNEVRKTELFEDGEKGEKNYDNMNGRGWGTKQVQVVIDKHTTNIGAKNFAAGMIYLNQPLPEDYVDFRLPEGEKVVTNWGTLIHEASPARRR